MNTSLRDLVEFSIGQFTSQGLAFFTFGSAYSHTVITKLPSSHLVVIGLVMWFMTSRIVKIYQHIRSPRDTGIDLKLETNLLIFLIFGLMIIMNSATSARFARWRHAEIHDYDPAYLTLIAWTARVWAWITLIVGQMILTLVEYWIVKFVWNTAKR